MTASKSFSETCSKGFYMATGTLSHEDILAMAKASEAKNHHDRERLEQKAKAFRESQ